MKINWYKLFHPYNYFLQCEVEYLKEQVSGLQVRNETLIKQILNSQVVIKPTPIFKNEIAPPVMGWAAFKKSLKEATEEKSNGI
jgi:hypothetical protein